MSDNDPSEPVDAGAQVHDDDRDFELPDHVALSGPRVRDGFHYVPGELLIREQDYNEPERGFRRILDDYDFRPHTDRGPRPRDGRSLPPEERRDPRSIPGVVMLTMTGRGEGHLREVPQILDTIRTVDRAVRAPQVAPNHVFFGSTHALWGPARPVRLAERKPRIPKDGPGKGVTIVVLDTGTVERGNDFDEPDENRDMKLDYEAGHGIFIEGVIRRYAPGATVVHKRVLTSDGRVSDTSLAMELTEVLEEGTADIVNLSLGGYTYDNRGAYAFNRVLHRLRGKRPDVAFVAAAGNDHTDRPFFPAATKGVIAVAAHKPGDTHKRAPYSNFGWWIDVRAKGEHDSTFYDVGPKDEHGGLTAPGGLTLADFKGAANWAGTSFAAPVMSGAIAAKMTEDGTNSARDAARLLVNDAAAANTYQPELGVLIEPRDYAS